MKYVKTFTNKSKAQKYAKLRRRIKKSVRVIKVNGVTGKYWDVKES